MYAARASLSKTPRCFTTATYEDTQRRVLRMCARSCTTRRLALLLTFPLLVACSEGGPSSAPSTADGAPFTDGAPSSTADGAPFTDGSPSSTADSAPLTDGGPPPPGPTCTDGLRNENETDIDCGGSCPQCADGMSCASAADCTSGYCSGTCQTNPYDPNGCLKWNGQNALQDALDANDCVLVLPGTYDLGEALHVAAGKKLTGEAGMRATTILRASSTFDTTDVPLGRSSMILNSTTGNTTISHLTLDGSRRAVRIICCSNYMLDDVVVENATCDGVDVSGPGVVVQNSEIAFNASDGAGGGLCMSAAAPYGGGVYCQGYPAAISVNLQLLNNTIHDNFGMGIDINGCHHGTISGNNIYANNGPAAIGLYGASQWTVSGNAVSHPHNATYNPVFHPLCDGGPIGSGSAALYICQDTDANGFYSTENTVTDNHFSGKYGILSIGADEVQPYWAPRKSVFQSNVLTGSVFGCADDFAPGQWFSDDNVWAGNGCGTPTGAPVYF